MAAEKIKKEGRLKLSIKNNPLDEMKMAMLGFEQGYALAEVVPAHHEAAAVHGGAEHHHHCYDHRL